VFLDRLFRDRLRNGLALEHDAMIHSCYIAAQARFVFLLKGPTNMDLAHVERPLVFFHDRCTDGWCAAWLARRRWADAELVPVNYGDSKKDSSIIERGSGRHVLVVDFSLPRDDLLKLREIASSLLVLDHHKTAAADLAGLDFCVFDMDRSGVGLALPGVDAMRERGASILAYVGQQVERIAEHACQVAWPEGEILAVNSPVLQSEVGNALALKAPLPLRTALVWYRDVDVYRCSLRSVEGGADVSALAKSRGGGGHVRAVGFESTEAP
jgi:hypothetical protein